MLPDFYMPAAPISKNDADRLADLSYYRILDTPSEASFDQLTRLAGYICQAPVSLISLVDKHRQWFKSVCGLNINQTPRQQAFCGYTILGKSPFIVEDATTDDRVKDNPLVLSDPKIRFYAVFRWLHLGVITSAPYVWSILFLESWTSIKLMV